MSIYPPTGTLEIKNATLKIPVVDLQYTSNTAKLEANSNVVTEFSRSKKLIKYPRVALTSAAQTESGYEGYFVSQASGTLNTNSSRQAWAFFDIEGSDGTSPASPHLISSTDRFDSNGNYTGGDSLANVSGDWIYIRLPDKIQLQSVALWARYGGDRNPIDATVLGSLNGTIWSVLGSWTGASFTAGKSSSFTINSIQYYDYIGFVFEKIEASSSGRYVNFHEIDLYGVPEYDPEAHGTDVTVKSYPNVPNTDWLEVYYDAKGETTMPNPVTDLAGGDQDASVYGVTLDTTNEAFVFNGSSYLETDIPQITTGVWPFTMSFWFKVNAHIGSTWNYLAHLGIRGTHGDSTLVGLKNDRIAITTWGDSQIVSSVVPVPGVWYHVTSTWPGGPFYDNAKLYINAVSYGDSSGTRDETSPLSFPTSENKLTLGKQMNTTSDYFDGSIANFRLFNRVLTTDEIYQLYAYQKEYFGHGDLSMTLKAGRLGIGTSEPKAALDVKGDVKFSGMPNMTESIFFYIDGSAGDNYPIYQNTHEYYQNKFIPPGIGSYGVDLQWYTTSYYTSTNNDLFKSHFDTMVYWLKNAPIGHVHKLNWVTDNTSCYGTTFGQKNNGTQIRLWGYFPAYNTGYSFGHNKRWNDALIFNMSSATELSIFYDGYTISN